MLITACKNNPVKTEDNLHSFNIESSAFVVSAGNSIQLKAKVILGNGTEQDVTSETEWMVSPGNIGNIDKNGFFSSISGLTGLETVTAIYKSKTDSIQIEILPRAVAFTILPAIINVKTGDKIQFEAYATFENAVTEKLSSGVKWSLFNNDIATISDNGLLQTNATGNLTVKADFLGLHAESNVIIQSDYESRFRVVEIPSGPFIMGDNNGSPEEKPEHEVHIDAFEIGRFEITNQEYVQFLNAAIKRNDISVEVDFVYSRTGPYRNTYFTDLNGDGDLNGQQFILYGNEPLNPEFSVLPGYESHPVIRMTWYGAAAFCQYYGFRLPTEAEWEKACRGGKQLIYGTMDGSISHDLANYSGIEGNDIYRNSAPVGSFPSNPYGLYDMSGNAAEFVFDFFDSRFYENSPHKNPAGPPPHTRTGLLPLIPVVIRGGAWDTNEQNLRSSSRDKHEEPHTGVSFISTAGFRVARTIF